MVAVVEFVSKGTAHAPDMERSNALRSELGMGHVLEHQPMENLSGLVNTCGNLVRY